MTPTWTGVVSCQTTLDVIVSVDNGSVAGNTSVFADSVLWAFAADAGRVATGANSAIVVLRFRTLIHAVLFIQHVFTLVALVWASAVAGLLALRVTDTACDIVHFVESNKRRSFISQTCATKK